MRQHLRTLPSALCVALAAPQLIHAQSHGWVTTLGRDTVQVEQATRSGSEITGLLVTRAPTPRILRYRIEIAPDGSLVRYEQADVHAAALSLDPTRSSMLFTRDSIVRDAVARGNAVSHRIAAPHGGYPFGTIPLGSSFQVLELALADARRTATDSVMTLARLSPLGFQPAPSRTPVLYAAPDSMEIDYFGQGRFGVKLDSAGRLIRSDWRGTTYQVLVTRVAAIDAAAIGERWRLAAADNSGFGPLSPRDTNVTLFRGAALRIIYGRPAQRGRSIWGGVVPWGAVWRLGADFATHLETSDELLVGSERIPAGRYTLWMLPQRDGAQLIVSRLVDVFGTQYSPAQDLARIPMERRRLRREVERLSIDVRDERLVVAWGDASYSVRLRVP